MIGVDVGYVLCASLVGAYLLRRRSILRLLPIAAAVWCVVLYVLPSTQFMDALGVSRSGSDKIDAPEGVLMLEDTSGMATVSSYVPVDGLDGLDDWLDMVSVHCWLHVRSGNKIVYAHSFGRDPDVDDVRRVLLGYLEDGVLPSRRVTYRWWFLKWEVE